MKKKIIAAFSIIFICLITIELFSFVASKMNLLVFNDTPTYKTYSNGQAWRNEKHPWGAWHKENATDEHILSCLNVTYQSNDVGARDTRDYLPLQNDNNIAVLGDSFVEGFGLNIEDTVPYHIEKATSKMALNFGAAGDFGPLQQVILYKELVSKIPHDEIIYFFLPSNDFVDNSFEHLHLYAERYRPYFIKNEAGVYETVYPNATFPSDTFPSNKDKSIKGRALSLVQNILMTYTSTANTIRTALHLSKHKPKQKSDGTIDRGYFTNNKDAVDGALHYVDELFRLFPESHKKTMVIIPIEEDLKKISQGTYSYNDLPWFKDLQNIAETHNVKFIDLAPHFISEKKDNDYTTWFHTCDGHWNSHGAQKAAEIVLNK
jgi:hypothetical protein